MLIGTVVKVFARDTALRTCSGMVLRVAPRSIISAPRAIKASRVSSRVGRSCRKDPSTEDQARGYALFIYPLCNPAGFEDNTRLSRAGHALNRLFWTESSAPEVRYLESEIWMQAFHGIINLRSDAESAGIYGFASGAVFSEALLEPALRAAGDELVRLVTAFCGGQARFLNLIWFDPTVKPVSPATVPGTGLPTLRHFADLGLVFLRSGWDGNESVFAFTPREGLGIAVDLGTTTIVAQLLDLQTGHVLAVRAAPISFSIVSMSLVSVLWMCL